MKTIRLVDKWNYCVVIARQMIYLHFHFIGCTNQILLSLMDLPVASTTKMIPVHQHRHSNFEPHRLIMPLPLILSLEHLFDCLFTPYKQQPITIDSMSLFRLSASTISTQRSRKKSNVAECRLPDKPHSSFYEGACTMHTRHTLCLTRLVWLNI